MYDCIMNQSCFVSALSRLQFKQSLYNFTLSTLRFIVSEKIMSQDLFCTSFTFKPGAMTTQTQEAPQAGAVAQSAPNMAASDEVAAMNLSPAVMAAYRKKFNAFDLNKDGIITRREFLAVSKVFGYSLTSEEIMVRVIMGSLTCTVGYIGLHA